MCISRHGWEKFSDLWCLDYCKMHMHTTIYDAPSGKTFPKVFTTHTPRQREITHSPRYRLSSPLERGEETMMRLGFILSMGNIYINFNLTRSQFSEAAAEVPRIKIYSHGFSHMYHENYPNQYKNK